MVMSTLFNAGVGKLFTAKGHLKTLFNSPTIIIVTVPLRLSPLLLDEVVAVIMTQSLLFRFLKRTVHTCRQFQTQINFSAHHL